MTSQYLPLSLTLHAPVIITAPSGDPNTAESLAYVPGAALRGAVARAIGQQPDQGQGSDDLNDLVLNGGVRYLNAYLLVNGRRSLPPPISWRVPKAAADGNDVTVEDVAAYQGAPGKDHDRSGQWPGEEIAGRFSDYVTLDSPDRRYASPRRMARTHHQRDPQRGRPWRNPETGESVGALYDYEALDAGQRFGGVIAVDSDRVDIQRTMRRLQELLASPVLLGRSRRAGYGGEATVQWGERRDREPDGPPFPAEGRDIASGEQFRALLVSDYLGRDAVTGQPDPWALGAELQGRLGGSEVVTVQRRRQETHTVGGYNRTWGMPLPERAAAAAGSVLLLRAEQAIAAATLRAVEDEGLGERRNDGFGRCWFREPPASTVRLKRARRTGHDKPDSELPAALKALEQRLAWDRVQQRVTARAGELTASATPPSSSLLGRLRVPLRADAETALEQLHQWLDEHSEERLAGPARKALQHSRLSDTNNKQSLLEWLKHAADVTAEDDWLAQQLKLDAIAQRSAIDPPEPLRARLDEPPQHTGQAGEGGEARSRLRAWLAEPPQDTRARALLIDAVLALLQRTARATTTEGQERGTT